MEELKEKAELSDRKVTVEAKAHAESSQFPSL